MELSSLYSPREAFLPFHQRWQRMAALVCHRRAGKTVAGINDLVDRGIKTRKEHGRYSYVAPFREQAKSVAWDYLLRYSEPFRVKHNIAELSVDLLTGARVRLFGADNPDAMRGLYHDGILLDEPAQMKPRFYPEIIRPSLSDRLGWAVFMGTPQGKNEFWEIVTKARQDTQGWFNLTLKASESGILPQSELEAAKADMDEDEYAQEYECSFEAAIRGSFYGKVINQMGARLGSWPFVPGFKVNSCWDLGYTDDTVLWLFQVIQNRPIFFDLIAGSGLEIGDYFGLLDEKKKEYGFQLGEFYLPHDAKAKSLQTGRSIQDAFIRKGVAGRIVPELSVQDGINATRKLLQHCCIDEEKCAVGVEALRQYQREWDEDKKAFRQKPRHDWCVTADTPVLTRYGMRRIMDLSIDDEVATSWGWRAHLGARMTRPNAPLVAVTFADGFSLRCTPDHPFKTDDGWRYAADLAPGTLIQSFSTPLPNTSTENSTAGGRRAVAISAMVAAISTVMRGRLRLARYRMVVISTTATQSMPTTVLKILNVWMLRNTAAFLRSITLIMHEVLSLLRPERVLQSGMPARRDEFGIAAMLSRPKVGSSGDAKSGYAIFASSLTSASSGPMATSRSFAPPTAKRLRIASVRHLSQREDVWCISVPGIEEFALGNGALVHNTSHYADAMRMGAIGWQEDYRPPAVFIPPKYRMKPPMSEGVTLEEMWKTLPSHTRHARI